jgi:lysophospholipase L1-like esterase
MFRWQGLYDNRITLIADSMAKWVRQVPHTMVQAIPGLTLQRAYQKIWDRTFQVRNFQGIILMIGTNNVESHTPTASANLLKVLLDLINSLAPRAKIAVTGILPRPKDWKTPPDSDSDNDDNDKTTKTKTKLSTKLQHDDDMDLGVMDTDSTSVTRDPPIIANQPIPILPKFEKICRETNSKFRKLCKKRHVLYLQSWKCITSDDDTTNWKLFAEDDLHLNGDGIGNLQRYMRGNAATLLGRY